MKELPQTRGANVNEGVSWKPKRKPCVTFYTTTQRFFRNPPKEAVSVSETRHQFCIQCSCRKGTLHISNVFCSYLALISPVVLQLNVAAQNSGHVLFCSLINECGWGCLCSFSVSVVELLAAFHWRKSGGTCNSLPSIETVCLQTSHATIQCKNSCCFWTKRGGELTVYCWNLCFILFIYFKSFYRKDSGAGLEESFFRNETSCFIGWTYRTFKTFQKNRHYEMIWKENCPFFFSFFKDILLLVFGAFLI